MTITGTGSIGDPFVVSITAVTTFYEWDDANVTDVAPAAGNAESPPATPEGYLRVVLNGEDRFIPYY